MTGAAPISIREYSRRRGCTDTAVRKAIAAGKIVKGIIDQHTKRPKILPEIADAEWAAYVNPNYPRVTKSGRKTVETEPEEDDRTAPPSPPPVEPPKTGRSLAELKRLTAEVNLQTAAIELKRKKGELVDKKQVYQQLFAVGQEIKSKILAVPDIMIDQVFASQTRNEAHTVLLLGLTKLLEEIAEIFDRQELDN